MNTALTDMFGGASEAVVKASLFEDFGTGPGLAVATSVEGRFTVQRFFV